MEILAFASFIALVVAWCVAPTRSGSGRVTMLPYMPSGAGIATPQRSLSERAASKASRWFQARMRSTPPNSRTSGVRNLPRAGCFQMGARVLEDCASELVVMPLIRC